ncbi:50S ribosomal protein L25 [Candidatus Margulisiibacteriota bacterium]
MEENTLEVVVRQETGKENVKRLRAAGDIPAVLYGRHMKESVVLSVSKNLFDTKLTKSAAGLNTIFKMIIKDKDKETTEIAIIHDVQFNVITDDIIHIDFHQINVNEKINATIPVRFIGIAPGVKKGGHLVEFVSKLDIQSLPMDLPPYIEVDVSALEMGEGIRIRDLNLADKLEIFTSGDQLLILVEGPRREEAVVEEGATEAPSEPAAKGEASAEKS